MNKLRVAVPAVGTGDLEASLSGHFGHCDVFSLIDIEDGQVVEVSTAKNVEHSQGGCLLPVRHLESKKVDAIIVEGMGIRPLLGFRDVGIKVYKNNGGKTVGDVITSFLKGELNEMSETAVCGGGGHH